MQINRDQLQRIRSRHRGYRITLIYELLLLLLPLAQLFTPLLSLLLIALAVVSMVFVNLFSGLRRTAPMMVALGCAAIGLEVVWRAALVLNPAVGKLITVPHVAVWLLYLVALMVRSVKALIREPFVTMSVLLGAASGYLTLGIAGGVMFTSLWVLEPSAFLASALPTLTGNSIPNGAAASALMLAFSPVPEPRCSTRECDRSGDGKPDHDLRPALHRHPDRHDSRAVSMACLTPAKTWPMRQDNGHEPASTSKAPGRSTQLRSPSWRAGTPWSPHQPY